MSIKIIDEPVKDKNSRETWIMVSISNSATKFIKSAVMLYEGDKDDLNNQQLKQEVRDGIHEMFKKLNPS